MSASGLSHKQSSYQFMHQLGHVFEEGVVGLHVLVECLDDEGDKG